MAAVINKTNLAVINTAFYTAINEAFSGKTQTQYELFTHKMAASGTSVDVVVVDGEPTVREWLGERVFHDLTAFRRNYPVRTYEKSLRIPVDEINGDQGGVIAQRVTDFVKSAAFAYDDIVISELVSNPTGYDGTTLLSNSHGSVGGSGTTDNLETAAVTFALANTANDAVKQMKSIYGEPIEGAVTHLMVGTAQERIGMEITGSDRPVVMGSTGTQDAGSAGQSSVLLKNYIGGKWGLIVSPRITGNEWFAMNLSAGSRKPMVLAEFAKPSGVLFDKPTDACVAYNDEVHALLTFKCAPIPGDWHTIYGSVTA